MGALNAAIDRAGHIRVSVTFVTGVLVRFGQGFGRSARPWSERVGLGSARLSLARLITGGALGAFAYAKIGEAVISAAVGFACLLRLPRC